MADNHMNSAVCAKFIFVFVYFLPHSYSLSLGNNGISNQDDTFQYRNVGNTYERGKSDVVFVPSRWESDVPPNQDSVKEPYLGFVPSEGEPGRREDQFFSVEADGLRDNDLHTLLDEVFIQDTSATVPSQEKVDDFYAEVKLDNDKIKGLKEKGLNFTIAHWPEASLNLMYEKSMKNIPNRVNLMDRLWSALIDGSLPAYEDSLYQEENPKSWNYAETIQNFLVDGSAIEIGSGASILHIAKMFPKKTSVGVITSDTFIIPVTQVVQAEGLSNLYLTRIDPELLEQRMEELHNDPQVLFGNIMITNLTSLVGNLLPHEFEEMLGRAISVARRGFVMGMLPNGKGNVFFERNWSSLEDLVKRSCSASKMTCSLRNLGQQDLSPSSHSDTGWSPYNTIMVKIKMAKRPLTKHHCSLLRPKQQCYVKFGEESNKYAIVFDDKTEESLDINPEVVSLSTLLRLGATDETRGDVLVKALQMDWSTGSFLPARLCVLHDHVTTLDQHHLTTDDLSSIKSKSSRLHIPRPDTEDGRNESADPALTKHITQNKNQSLAETATGSKVWEPPHITQEKNSDSEIPRMETDTQNHVTKKTINSQSLTSDISVAKSQVDGVAQQWNRVDVESPTAGRKDDQQYQAMGRHWDREDRTKGDPLVDQENKQLDRFNEAWEREQPQLTQSKHRVGSSENVQQGNTGDNVLRRDEKELRRAMGFLLGETDMKEVEAVLKHHQLRQARPLPKVLSEIPIPGNNNVKRMSLTQNDDPVLQNIYRSKTLRLMPRIGNVDIRDVDVVPGRSVESTVGKNQLNYQQKAKRRDKGPVLRQKANTNFGQQFVKSDASLKRFPGFNVGRGPHTLSKSGSLDQKHEISLILSTRSTTEFSKDKIQLKASTEKSFHPIDKEKNISFNLADKTEDLETGKTLKTNTDIPRNGVDIDGKQSVKNDNNNNNPPSHHHREKQKTDNVHAPDYGDPAPDYVAIDHYNPGEGTPQEDYGNEVDHPNIPEDGRPFDLGGNLWEHLKPDPEGQAFGLHDEGETPNGKSKDYLKEESEVGNQPQEEEPVDEQEEANDQQMYDGFKVSENDYHANYGRKLLSKETRNDKTSNTLVESFHGLPNRYKSLVKHALHVKNKERGENLKRAHKEVLEDEPTLAPRMKNHPENTNAGTEWIDREESVYDQFWSIIKGKFINPNKHQSFNVFTYGTRSQSLIGVKMARTYPTANVLSIMPHKSASSAEKLRKMIDSVGVSNMVLLAADLNAGLVETLSHSPDLARYQVLGLNVFEMILHLRLGFPFYLGRLLSLASTSFLQVPHPQHLKALTQYLRPSMDFVEISQLKGLVREALRLVSAENVTLTLLSQPDTNINVLQVQIHSLKRPVQTDCATSMAYLHIRPTGTVYLTNHVTQMEVRLERARKAFSLHFLLEAGLRNEDAERARFFKHYLKLSLRQDMCPLHFVWYNYSLLHRPIFSTALPLSLAVKTSRLYNAQTSLKVLQKELDTEPFSFMEYGCHNSDLITSLAAAHPQSSLIALVNEDADTANRIHQRAKLKNLVNLVTLNTTINERLSSKIMRSPEFLRYQYIGLEAFIKFVTSLESRYQFDLMMGQTVATGVTTFTQIPSDKIFSLAMTTFFPWSYSGKPPPDGHGPQMYYLNEHPLPVYQNSERKIIAESLKADVQIEVSTKVISPHRGGTNELLPWKLLRIDVRNLTTEVDHHFEYELDGHSRKYTLRCEASNRTHHKVWLVRQPDGFRIPYGSVHVITLIALLRMGLLEDIKTSFYEKFLNLPLYEDMAPWNIVFDAGNLTYIDFDSRNVTLNHLAPAAFQLIVMLMNYERTVKDFGKCNQPAKVMFGITALGRCVGSQYLGPCQDKMNPVPCGDGTCRSTYMDCLQALQTLEKKKEALIDKVRLTLRRGETGLIGDATHLDFDNWKFDLSGPKIHVADQG